MWTARELAELSFDFLASVKRNSAYSEYQSKLTEIDEAEFSVLSEDVTAAKAFWINLYNAYVQLLLEETPSAYENKRRFFGSDRIPAAGTRLSLDDIEHGILRSSKWKYGLGYVPRMFPNHFEQKYRLPDMDARIHFALNCGAESCPSIVAYSPEDINQELDLSAELFLHQSTEWNDERDEVRISRLFLYYRGDFGGRSGIYEWLEQYGVIADGIRPQVRYTSYDWTLQKAKYRDQHDDKSN